MQTEKIELETTVVDETKERESYCGQVNRRFSGECAVNHHLFWVVLFNVVIYFKFSQIFQT